jgi:streptogramin lyase
MASMRWTLAVAAIAGLTAASPPANPSGTTSIAGNGALGLADGPASQAQFLVPTGLARGRDGTIYVSDQAGQRIRSIRNGVVRTVAGTGDLGKLGMSVLGGYRNGAAAQAQFNQPMGLALAPDGALYVADSKNGCIRKIEHGLVSTVVGAPGSAAPVDGPLATARLVSPRSLAFDATGALWIADFGGGLRRLANGALETIPLTSFKTDKILSVSVSPDTDDPEVIAVAPLVLFDYHIKSKTDTYIQTAAAAEGGRFFGAPSQVLAIGHRQVLFTDLVSSNVRYLRLSTPPFVTSLFTHVIAGGEDERGVDNAGYAEGAPDAARFNEPRGMLVEGDRLIVADAGNRRVRSIPLPHFRTPESGVVHDYDNKHYEIAYVGPSVVFWDSYDDRSICGAIEARINASHRVNKPVRCHSIRIDGPTVPAIEDYVTTYLTVQPHIDLVIIPIAPGSAANFPGTARTITEGAAAFRTSMVPIMKALKPIGGRVVMVWQEENIQTSDAEDLSERETNFPYFPDELYSQYVQNRAGLEAGLKGSGLYQYDLFSEVVNYEKRVDPKPLYGVPDTHTNARGNVFVGEHVADYLLRDVIGH